MKDLKSGMRNSDFYKGAQPFKGITFSSSERPPEAFLPGRTAWGSFPPLSTHNDGHLALIREARRTGDLDEILVLLDIAAMDKG